jgi:hypothetical protein
VAGNISSILKGNWDALDLIMTNVCVYSGADGRNLPFSEWIHLGSHDCAITTDLVLVQHEGQWRPGERVVLSGITLKNCRLSMNYTCSGKKGGMASSWVVLFGNDTCVSVEATDTRPFHLRAADTEDPHIIVSVL